MSRLLFSMSAFARAVFPRGADVASPALVFFTSSVIVVAQLPANLLLRSGRISAGVLVNELIAVAGIPLLLIWWQRFDPEKLLPFRRLSPTLTALLIIFMMGAAFAMDYATAASELVLPLPREIKDILESLMAVSSQREVVWKFFVLCVVPGVCEEIFFRGFLQASLAERWGTRRALIASATMFALLHGNPYYVHLYFLLGLIFGGAFAVTGSLWASILCHVVNNGWTFLNQARDFHLPIDNAPVFVNASLCVGGVLIALAAGVLIVKAAKAELHDRSFAVPGESRPSRKSC
jgi:membrane protease YdiL (CAAX protease family)